MATTNIRLPDDLIHREQDRAKKIAAMQALVAQGQESGVSAISIDEVWSEARRLAGVQDGD